MAMSKKRIFIVQWNGSNETEFAAARHLLLAEFPRNSASDKLLSGSLKINDSNFGV